MSSQNKVVRFKKRKNINIGIIIFLILFIYIVINVSIFLTKDQLTIYEVHEGSTTPNNHITGIILRDEQIVTNSQAGYISYYQKEGARVAKNEAVYSVDQTDPVYAMNANNEVNVSLSEKDDAEIKHDIRTFQNNFSDSDFTSVYSFQENAQSTVLDILNSTVINQNKALVNSESSTYSYQIVPSADSGIISYYTDSFENVTPQTIRPDMFKIKDYKRTNLRTTQMVERNSSIYKLITSETWSIILPISKKQYKELSGEDHISFTILEDQLKTNAALTLLQHDGSYFAQLSMDKYLSDYLSDRFLDVELDFDSADGLKIPVSSLVEKEFSLVPSEYFTIGAESQDLGLIKKTYSKNGDDISYNFIATQIYYDDGTYCYIDTDLFGPGTVIQFSTDSKEYTITKTGKLTGVYNVNLGYAVFKKVDILSKNEEYCIVEDNTKYGLSAYDQIALDGSTAVNQEIIY